MDLTSFDALNSVKSLSHVPQELAEALGLNSAPGVPYGQRKKSQAWKAPAVEEVLNSAWRNKSDRMDALMKLAAQVQPKSLMDRAAERVPVTNQTTWGDGLGDIRVKGRGGHGRPGGRQGVRPPAQAEGGGEGELDLLSSEEEREPADLAAIGLRAFMGGRSHPPGDETSGRRRHSPARPRATCSGVKLAINIKNMYRGDLNPTGTAPWNAVLIDRTQGSLLYDEDLMGRRHKQVPHAAAAKSGVAPANKPDSPQGSRASSPSSTSHSPTHVLPVAAVSSHAASNTQSASHAATHGQHGQNEQHERHEAQPLVQEAATFEQTLQRVRGYRAAAAERVTHKHRGRLSQHSCSTIGKSCANNSQRPMTCPAAGPDVPQSLCTVGLGGENSGGALSSEPSRPSTVAVGAWGGSHATGCAHTHTGRHSLQEVHQLVTAGGSELQGWSQSCHSAARLHLGSAGNSMDLGRSSYTSGQNSARTSRTDMSQPLLGSGTNPSTLGMASLPLGMLQQPAIAEGDEEEESMGPAVSVPQQGTAQTAAEMAAVPVPLHPSRPRIHPGMAYLSLDADVTRTLSNCTGVAGARPGVRGFHRHRMRMRQRVASPAQQASQQRSGALTAGHGQQAKPRARSPAAAARPGSQHQGSSGNTRQTTPSHTQPMVDSSAGCRRSVVSNMHAATVHEPLSAWAWSSSPTHSNPVSPRLPGTQADNAGMSHPPVRPSSYLTIPPHTLHLLLRGHLPSPLTPPPRTAPIPYLPLPDGSPRANLHPQSRPWTSAATSGHVYGSHAFPHVPVRPASVGMARGHLSEGAGPDRPRSRVTTSLDAVSQAAAEVAERFLPTAVVRDTTTE